MLPSSNTQHSEQKQGGAQHVSPTFNQSLTGDGEALSTKQDGMMRGVYKYPKIVDDFNDDVDDIASGGGFAAGDVDEENENFEQGEP